MLTIFPEAWSAGSQGSAALACPAQSSRLQPSDTGSTHNAYPTAQVQFASGSIMGRLNLTVSSIPCNCLAQLKYWTAKEGPGRGRASRSVLRW